MTRRSPSTLALSVAAAGALLLTACGEQTPGGMPEDGQGQTQQTTVANASGDGDRAGHTEQPEQGEQPESSGQAGRDQQLADADPDDPIVVQIGDEEFRTNMAIYRRYDAAKGGPLALQSPVEPAQNLAGGMKQDYTTGSIYWHPATGAQIVRGQILATFLDNGGPSGRLGWPVGDETAEDEAIYSDFQHGQIRLEDQSIRIVEAEG